MEISVTTQQLRSFIPFSRLSQGLLEAVCRDAEVQHVLAGEPIFAKESADKRSLFLLSGQVRLEGQKHSQDISSGVHEESLHELLGLDVDCQRVIALEDSVLLRLEAGYLSRILAWHQMIQDAVLELDDEAVDQQWLEKLLANPVFNQVPANNIREMLNRMQLLNVTAGSVVIRQGDAADACYFIRQGRAEVIRTSVDREHVLALLQEGDCFGEEALLSEQPRNASVKMIENGRLLMLARSDFIELLKEPVVAQCPFEQARRRVIEAVAQWLDVRREDEYEHAHAHSSLHMPLDVLRLKSRLLNRNTQYVCYCNDGSRSQSAVFLLTQLGFKACMLLGGTDALPAVEREQFLSESGPGYLLRRNGHIEASQ